MTKARVSLNLPASLKAAAEDYAARDGVSLNQFIALALAEKAGAFSASEFFSERAVSADRARARFLEGCPKCPADSWRLTNQRLASRIG